MIGRPLLHRHLHLLPQEDGNDGGLFRGKRSSESRLLILCPGQRVRKPYFQSAKPKTLIDGRFAFELWPGSAQLELTLYTGIACQRGGGVLLVAERVNTS
jgi:hypothetical protein